MAWAKRQQIGMDTRLLDNQIIRVVLVQEEHGEKFYLQGNFDAYRALPPIWDWRDDSWSISSELSLSPSPENNPFTSMFLKHNNQSIICAPFNRLAYGIHEGPHKDWGDPAQWVTTGKGYVYAVTIGDMLQAVLRDFRFTNGRME